MTRLATRTATLLTLAAVVAGVSGCGRQERPVEPVAPPFDVPMATVSVALSSGDPSLEGADARWVLTDSVVTRTEQVRPDDVTTTSVHVSADERTDLRDLTLDALRSDTSGAERCADRLTVSVATARGGEELTSRTYRLCPGSDPAVRDLVRALDAPLPAACPPPAPCAPPCTRSDPFARWEDRDPDEVVPQGTAGAVVAPASYPAVSVPQGRRCLPPTPSPSG